MQFLILGWRSLWRHTRRTLFSLLAVGLGLFFALLYVGVSDGMMNDATQRMDRTGLGHVQLHAPGFRDELDVTLTLKHPDALLAKLTLPPGAKASARVLAMGLLTTARGSEGAQVVGVDPEAEAGVSASIREILKGEPLKADDDLGLLLGVKLAKKLKLEVGHKVRVTVQRADGELGAQLFRVRGIFGGVSSSLSAGTVYVTTGGARKLVGLEDAAHEVTVLLANGREADAVAKALRPQAGGGVEVLSLGEFLPFWRDMEKMMDAIILATIFVVYLLVGLGILNVLLMSVLERTHEFGVMMAIGTQPRSVVLQVLAEGVWLATIACAIGLLLGLGANAYGAAYGLFDYSKAMGETYETGGIAMSMNLKSDFSIPRALQTTGIVWLLTTLVGIYPAWRVSKLQPAEALRRR